MYRYATQLKSYIERHHKWLTPLVILGYILLITGLWLPYHWNKYGSLDHSLTYTSYEAIRLLIWEYGQFPLYLHNINGGIDLWADPQSMALGIFNIFPLLLGAVIGHKVALLIAYVIGTTGTYHFAKKIQKNTLVALAISLSYASLGYFSHHLIEAGHSNFLYFHLTPILGYAVYAQFTSKITIWNTLIVVLVYTQMILGGALPMLVITLCCLTSILLVSTWPRYTFTLFQALLGVGSILLSGIKIYPFFTVFGGSPRVVSDTAGMNLQHLLLAFTDSKPYTSTGSISYHGWWEHGIGLGIIIPVLALFFLPKLKNWKGILVVLVLTVWFGMGNSPSYINPWYLANTYLPVFENFRAPFRFFIGPALALILIIPIGLRAAPHLTKHVLLALSISLLYATSNVLSISKISTTSVNSSDIENEYLEMNINTKVVDIHPDLEYYQYLMLAEDKHLINTKYPLLDDIQHDDIYWINGATITTNNQQSISLIATKKQVLTSINYSPFWHISGGTLQNRDGKISIDASTGSEIQLHYRPTYWTIGWIISGIGLILLAALGYWGIRRLQPTEDVLSDSL
jgi:hypothetical protein